MQSTTREIESALVEDLSDFPVRAWRVEEGLDATDDHAIWVWASVEPEDVNAEILSRLKAEARAVVRSKTDGLWAYVLIRGVDESVETT